MLDLWQNDQNNSAAPQTGEGHDLPATFGEGFEASWNEGQLFSQSVAGENSRLAALGDYLDEVKSKTGADIASQLDYGSSDTPISSRLLLNQTNDQIDKINKARGLNIDPLSDDDLEQRAVAKSRNAVAASAAMGDREQTFGSRAGSFLGSFASGATDPVNIATLPVAPETESVGILAAALRWGAVAGVSQAAIEAAGAPFHEEVQPGYMESGAPLMNVAGAAGSGFLLGGGTKALGNLWTRVKSGAWPQSVRDAGNVVESEANIASTNVLPGIDGEVANRTALQKSIESIVDGRQIDVGDIVTGSLLADYEKRLSPVMSAIGDVHEAQNAVQMERAAQTTTGQAELPFEQSARMQSAEDAIGKVAGHLQDLSREAGAALSPEEADLLARRVSAMPQDQAAAALDEFMLRPQTLRETLPEGGAASAARPLSEPVEPVAPPERVVGSPDYQAAIRADIDRERVAGNYAVPVSVDAEGNAVMRGVDDQMNDIDAYHAAADQIAACAAPVATEEA